MRWALVLLLALSGCRDDFAIADPDAGPADVREADVREADIGPDAPAERDAATLADAPAMDAVSATDASADAAIADVGVDIARPAESIRLATHQLRLLDGFYEINVLLAVLSGPPVATRPESFFLRFDGGAEVPGIPFDRPAANALCSESLRVTDSGTFVPGVVSCGKRLWRARRAYLRSGRNTHHGARCHLQRRRHHWALRRRIPLRWR